MIYQHKISEKIRHHECDANGGLKLHCLLDRLQDAAAEHAAFLNVGMDELAQKQLIWVLSRLKLQLDRPLCLGEMLEVVTFPCGVQRIFAHRCYDLRIDGHRVGTGGSFWLPVNALAGRPMNAKKILPPEIMDMPDVEKFFPDMDKLPELECDAVGIRPIGAGDVDLNHHLNNAVYARWITDILGEKFSSSAPRIREIQINYLASGQAGEQITLYAAADSDGKFAVYGKKCDGTVLFQAAGIVAE